MADLIDRQAAIKVMAELQGRATSKSELRGISRVWKQIKALPSTQSELVRCKDCRWGREACGNIECFADTNVPPEYHGYEWYCPNGERRTDE